MIDCIPQLVSSISAEAIIGSAAILLTVITLYQTRKHNRLSVTPHLNTFLNTTNDTISLKLLNNGIGPAKIDDITVYIDGIPHKGDLKKIAFQDIQIILLDSLKINHATHLDSTYSLLNGQAIELINVSVISNKYTNDEIEENLRRVQLLINYSSFYGKKDKLDTRQTFWNDRNNNLKS